VPVQYSYTSTPPMGRTACTEPQFLYSTAIPLLPVWTVRPVQILSACTTHLYLYSPMDRTACTDPQCLYSTAIPLLPLWTVRPVQTLIDCTVQVKLYSPHGSYGLYRFQCLYSTSIPLLPYGPYSLYRTSAPVQYSYTSTPPMDRTTCTEPQFLYSTAIPLLPYGPYGLYRASVPVQGCTLSLLFCRVISQWIHNIFNFFSSKFYSNTNISAPSFKISEINANHKKYTKYFGSILPTPRPWSRNYAWYYITENFANYCWGNIFVEWRHKHFLIIAKVFVSISWCPARLWRLPRFYTDLLQ